MNSMGRASSGCKDFSKGWADQSMIALRSDGSYLRLLAASGTAAIGGDFDTIWATLEAYTEEVSVQQLCFAQGCS
jgi:hypothetical protein